jgi:hypothetical protein
MRFSWECGTARIAPFAPTIDRVHADGGYAYGNIRIVCCCVNAALGQWGDSVFWQMIEEAAEKKQR